MKVCRKCGIELVVGENWYQSCEKNNNYICVECFKAYYCQLRKKLPYVPPIIVCVQCGREGRRAGRDLCRTCYRKKFKSRTVICVSCGEEKEHQAHGLCKTCHGRQWREEHKEETREYLRQWYLENREEKLAYQKQYREDHLEEIREAYYRQREEHPERWVQYYQNNAEAIKTRARKYGYERRARKANTTIGDVDIEAILELYQHTCVYCGSKDNLTLDHVVPLSKGGKHIDENLITACRSCNSSKGAKPLMKWLRQQPCSQAWVM